MYTTWCLVVPIIIPSMSCFCFCYLQAVVFLGCTFPILFYWWIFSQDSSQFTEFCPGYKEPVNEWIKVGWWWENISLKYFLFTKAWYFLHFSGFCIKSHAALEAPAAGIKKIFRNQFVWPQPFFHSLPGMKLAFLSSVNSGT